MALSVKDGNGILTSLKTTITGSDHMPHHVVQAVSGTVQVTASQAAPVYVTGNISVNQPINVDIDLSDKVTAVVSASEGNGVWVTSSTNYPVWITSSNLAPAYINGAVTVSNFPNTQNFNLINATSSYEGVTTIASQLTGASVVKIGAKEALLTILTGSEVTVSGTTNISGIVSIQNITASEGKLPISGTIALDYADYGIGSGRALVVKLTGSTFENDATHVSGTVRVLDVMSPVAVEVISAIQVTTSAGLPLHTTSSIFSPVYVSSSESTPVSVVSSNSYPVVTKPKPSTSIARNGFSSYGGPGVASIDWASTGSLNLSGTFIIANSSSNRVGLTFSNYTQHNLYVAVGQPENPQTNGFLLITTSSAPAVFTFILYPSGTYFAEQAFVNQKHSGFFVSSSNIDVSVSAYLTE